VDNRGVPQRFLGLECESTQGKIKLTQRLLIEKAAKQFDVKYGAKTPTKSESSINGNLESDLGEHQGEPLADEVKYRQLIGTLTYISRMTRPDVGFPINVLARRNASPSQRNYEAAKRVLQYLWQTRQEGHILKKPLGNGFEIYVDASYGGEESKSQTGVVITMGGQTVGWYSRRQDIIAQSITEAEYVACAKGAKDAAWMRQLWQEMTNESPAEAAIPILWTDNQGAEKLAQAATFHRRTRHILHKYHYIRHEVKNKRLSVFGVAGNQNWADIMTKNTKTWDGEWRKKILGDGN
jgi:hypothetical protein